MKALLIMILMTLGIVSLIVWPFIRNNKSKKQTVKKKDNIKLEQPPETPQMSEDDLTENIKNDIATAVPIDMSSCELVLFSSNPDTMLCWFCMLIGAPSTEPKIHIFLKDTISPESSLMNYSKNLCSSLTARIKSLDIKFFNLVTKEEDAEIVISISTLYVKINKKRRRMLRTKWTTTPAAEDIFKNGAIQAQVKNIALYDLPGIEAEGRKQLKTSDPNESANSILNARGFLKECAYLIAYKSILAA